MTEETGIAIIGAIAAAAGNIFAIIKSQMATTAATRAVAANTEATGSQAKLTVDLATKADANYRMLKELMAEFRVEAAEDRNASLERAIGNVWQTRERVLLARHEEVMDAFQHLTALLAGAAPGPRLIPGPEAHGITNLPPLQNPPKEPSVPN